MGQLFYWFYLNWLFGTCIVLHFRLTSSNVVRMIGHALLGVWNKILIIVTVAGISAWNYTTNSNNALFWFGWSLLYLHLFVLLFRTYRCYPAYRKCYPRYLQLNIDWFGEWILLIGFAWVISHYLYWFAPQFDECQCCPSCQWCFARHLK